MRNRSVDRIQRVGLPVHSVAALFEAHDPRTLFFPLSTKRYLCRLKRSREHRHRAVASFLQYANMHSMISILVAPLAHCRTVVRSWQSLFVFDSTQRYSIHPRIALFFFGTSDTSTSVFFMQENAVYHTLHFLSVPPSQYFPLAPTRIHFLFPSHTLLLHRQSNSIDSANAIDNSHSSFRNKTRTTT